MNNKNIELTILKAIGIIVVVSCHVGINLFNVIGIPISKTKELFPEYSYHMPLFIFTSGYFYKIMYENDVLNLAKKRFLSIKRYMKCNLFYMILCFVLININLLSRNIEFSLRSFFIEPFLGGFQFYFNGPAWFVPFLFLLQIFYIYLRKFIQLISTNSSINFKREFSFFIGLILVGALSTFISNIYPVVNDKMSIFQSFLRILFGLQFFQLGFLYKEFIEPNLNLTFLSFLLVIICKILIYFSFGYYTFSLRTIKFNNHITLPFVVSILGIIYCLHLTKFIIKISDKIKSNIIPFIVLIGENTWSIMMHHLFIKWSLNKIYNLSFIPESFMIFGNYFLTPILCIIIPISFSNFYKYKKSL